MRTIGPLIGMLHAPPLPGSPRFAGQLADVVTHVLRDAETLAAEGVPALLLENFGDAPFYPERVPGVTVAALTRLAVEVRRRFDLPLGVNVLRNDGESALAIAVAAGAEFIRVNVLTGVRVTDQGLVAGRAHELLRLRRGLDARGVAILADVDVKHSAPLGPRPLEEETADLVERGGADGVIVSGPRTGAPASLEQLRVVRHVAGGAPLYVGSGVTLETIDATLELADGWIVGTALKRDGDVAAPVDPQRIRPLVAALAGRIADASGRR
jgi:membrane complex biogenesis BtpA family protein